jgi:hypothetical protein
MMLALTLSLNAITFGGFGGFGWKVDGEGHYILDGEGNKIAIAT